MIVYNLNYFKWYYEKNFMNAKIIVFEKDIMELVNLDFHILHTLNLILFLNGNTIDHDMKIEMLCHIIQCYYCFGEHI
jgi:hypothetical protein